MKTNVFIKLYNNNKVVIENFSYITLLEIFLLIAPLITYPYLVRVIGMELYGVVITAQVLASYASKIIDFGSNSVCAKHVSINRHNKDMLSEIVCSVLTVRAALWVLILLMYIIIVLSVPSYREHFILFFLSYGLTFNDVLFPQYFFQGIEKMKYSTIINISVKLFFICLVFFFVKEPSDYLYVPLLYTIGYAGAGIFALYTIFYKMHMSFFLPKGSTMKVYVLDSLPLFATDLICTVKDKFSYFLLGPLAGMGSVVVYDLGLKINTLLTKPVQIISTVLFPRFAKNRNIEMIKKVAWIVTLISVLLVILTNIFLPWIVKFFIEEEVDLITLRVFTIAPILVSISSFITSNLFVAFGHNRYVLYSIIITTSTYIVSLLFILFTHRTNNIYSFVVIALLSYFVEFVYRIIIAQKISKKYKCINNDKK